MSRKIEPSLESVTVRGKYSVPLKDFDKIREKLLEYLVRDVNREWKIYSQVGNSIVIMQLGSNDGYDNHVKKTRPGVPFYFSLILIEEFSDYTLVEVDCRPIMWYRIANFGEEKFTENDIQEALIENKAFVKQVMSIFKGREIEPVSVYPIIQRTEIKSRLLNLGLKVTVENLDKAEKIF